MGKIKYLLKKGAKAYQHKNNNCLYVKISDITTDGFAKLDSILLLDPNKQ